MCLTVTQISDLLLKPNTKIVLNFKCLMFNVPENVKGCLITVMKNTIVRHLEEGVKRKLARDVSNEREQNVRYVFQLIKS